MRENLLILKTVKYRISRDVFIKEGFNASKWHPEDNNEGFTFKWRPFIKVMKEKFSLGIDLKEQSRPIAIIANFKIGKENTCVFTQLEEAVNNAESFSLEEIKEFCTSSRDLFIFTKVIFVRNFPTMVNPIEQLFYEETHKDWADQLCLFSIMAKNGQVIKLSAMYAMNIPAFYNYIATRNGSANLQDFKSTTLQEIVIFLKTGALRESDVHILEDVLNFERKFGHSKLKEQVEVILHCIVLKKANVNKIFEIAYEYDLENLKDKLMALLLGLKEYRDELYEESMAWKHLLEKSLELQKLSGALNNWED